MTLQSFSPTKTTIVHAKMDISSTPLQSHVSLSVGMVCLLLNFVTMEIHAVEMDVAKSVNLNPTSSAQMSNIRGRFVDRTFNSVHPYLVFQESMVKVL